MSIDILQEKIRKTKNPSILELALPINDLPPKFSRNAEGYASFCRELLEAMKGMIPAVRLSFTAFVLLGHDGLYHLTECLKFAAAQGYYVLLDAPEILSPASAKITADAIWGEGSLYPCDGLVISGYLGSDVIKPFLPYVREGKKDLFPVVRTSNKTAPEVQDLLTGSRLVHAAAADLMNRFGGDNVGRCGYARVGVLAGGNSAESLRNLRSKYPRLFLLVDDMDYSGCNAKNCSFAFDKFGHGALVCAGPTITMAWKLNEADAEEYLSQAAAAAERMKKNLTRYTTVL